MTTTENFADVIQPDNLSVIEEMTQKLFNEAGYSGDVYETDPVRLRYFENQAIKIIIEEKK